MMMMMGMVQELVYAEGGYAVAQVYKVVLLMAKEGDAMAGQQVMYGMSKSCGWFDGSYFSQLVTTLKTYKRPQIHVMHVTYTI